MKHWIAAALLSLAVATAAHGKEPLRLDASSDEAAEATWETMIDSATPAMKKKLLEAMLKINLSGVQSATEMIDNPELKSFGITRIKDKVAGLNAEEIIELGERVSTVKIEDSSR
jgi:hypothetical protein